MRFQHLFSLVAACAMALPLTANAAGLDGQRDQYLKACETSAKAHQVSAAGATQHCKCSAEVVDSKFTQEEVGKLNDGTASAALVDRLKTEVHTACGTAK
ncbi:hypothetical protein [Pseudomonas akapageensis]|uniref:hypothetical protein n=1 Tax=Pseudomonas akapageensis TaxID=2609961 RepID=UPI00140C2BBA|nr:hypothetical protein [Pseudomonas akapageensis]